MITRSDFKFQIPNSISRGSAGEARSMLCLLERIRLFQEVGSDIRVLKRKAESCSRQLKGWTQSIQNSDFKGERHVSQKTKRTNQAAQDREEFLRELAEIRTKAAAAAKN
jgi:hypothetical protein